MLKESTQKRLLELAGLKQFENEILTENKKLIKESDIEDEFSRKKQTQSKEERDANFDKKFADDVIENPFRTKEELIQYDINRFFEGSNLDKKFFLKEFYFCSINADFTHDLPEQDEADCIEVRKSHPGWKKNDYKLVLDGIINKQPAVRAHLHKLQQYLKRYEKTTGV